MEICYLKVCPKLGKCDNRGLPLNGAKKRGWQMPPSTGVLRRHRITVKTTTLILIVI